MKFLLIFQMCYSIANTCFPPMEERFYSSYHECSLSGYSKGYEFIAEMPKEQVENNHVILRFWCLPKKIEENEKKIDI